MSDNNTDVANKYPDLVCVQCETVHGFAPNKIQLATEYVNEVTKETKTVAIHCYECKNCGHKWYIVRKSMDMRPVAYE